jgi:aminopeptidase 2
MNLAVRVLYEPARLEKIAIEASIPNSVFTLDDRMGLVYDATALARAGFSEVSGALNLINALKNETECT